MFSHKLRSFSLALVLLLILFLSFLLILTLLSKRPSVQKLLIGKLADATGYDIHTQKIEVNLWHGIGVFVRGLEAKSRQGPEKISASGLRLILSARHLLRGRIVPIRLYLYRTKIEMAPAEGKSPLTSHETLLQRCLTALWIPGFEFLSIEKGEIRFSGSPFHFQDLNLSIHGKKDIPLTLGLVSSGDLEFRNEKVPFRLTGSLSPITEGKGFPSAQLMLETGSIPLKWIPFPSPMVVMEGQFKAFMKIHSDGEGPVSMDGSLHGESTRFSLLKEGRRQDFVLSHITAEFRSTIKGMNITIPFLRFKTPKTSITSSVMLDLNDRMNPYIVLEARGPYMELANFKRLFPSFLFAPWVEKRLLPLILKGQVKLEGLSLKGTLEQYKNLHDPRNYSSLGLRFSCKDLEVLLEGMKIPFKDVSASIALQNGELQISKAKGGFGQSIVRDARFHLTGLYTKKPSYDLFLEGIFDLQGLLKHRVPIPPDAADLLAKAGFISGRMACSVMFHTESLREFPGLKMGTFNLMDVSVRQQKFHLPLWIKKAEIHVDASSGNRFVGEGSWGKSTFEATGRFLYNNEGFLLEKSNILASVDLPEIILSFFPHVKSPLRSRLPLKTRLLLSQDSGGWNLGGEIDWGGVVIENDQLYIEPPGVRGPISFQLDVRPGKAIALKRMQCQFGDSSLELSGFYNWGDKNIFALNLFTPGISMAELGLKFKKGFFPTGGILKGNVKFISSHLNADLTNIIGKLEGHQFSFPLDSLPFPLRECEFSLGFSGKRLTIDSWKMRIGESLVTINGHLMGWKGLKGVMKVQSDFLDLEAFYKNWRHFLGDERSRDSGETMKNLDIGIKLYALKGRWKQMEWAPLMADLALREGDLIIKNARVKSGRGLLTLKGHILQKKEPKMLFSTLIRLNDQPVDELLQALGYKEDLLKGRLTMEAVLFMRGENGKELISGLAGSANIVVKQGVTKRSSTLVKVFDLLNIRKIFQDRPPESSQEGFYFESIGGHASIQKGILDTQDVVMKSPVINAVASGKIDLTQGTVDYTLGTQPLQTLDTLLSKIPILGYVLTGEDKSFLTYYFHVQGPLLDPSVTHVPFKNLGPGVAGVLKRLFLTPVRIFEELSRPPEGFEGPESPPEGWF